MRGAMMETLNEAKEAIAGRTGKVDVAMVLGSGLGDYANELGRRGAIPYGEIPTCRCRACQGHAGNLVVGHKAGKRIVAMQGRAHLYEGNSPERGRVRRPLDGDARRTDLDRDQRGRGDSAGARAGRPDGDHRSAQPHRAEQPRSVRTTNALGPRFPRHDQRLRSRADRNRERRRGRTWASSSGAASTPGCWGPPTRRLPKFGCSGRSARTRWA